MEVERPRGKLYEHRNLGLLSFLSTVTIFSPTFFHPFILLTDNGKGSYIDHCQLPACCLVDVLTEHQIFHVWTQDSAWDIIQQCNKLSRRKEQNTFIPSLSVPEKIYKRSLYWEVPYDMKGGPGLEMSKFLEVLNKAPFNSKALIIIEERHNMTPGGFKIWAFVIRLGTDQVGVTVTGIDCPWLY